ncbi:MAG: TetR/AcrR family transcriptional regulator [Limisphaerales bacterium]
MKTKEKVRRSETRGNLVAAAVKLMRDKGFTATSVDEICEAAGVTKGSFFHYFETKEELAKDDVDHFSKCQMQRFEAGSFNNLADPLDRLYGYLDYMANSIPKNPEVVKSCLIGNLTQELYLTNPEIRSVCAENFSWHNKKLQRLIEEAGRAHPPRAAVDAESLAQYFYATMQGSLIFAKAAQNTQVMLDNIEHFRNYLQTLFPGKEAVR